MDILNPRSLKAAARERLSVPDCDHKKLALIYMGVSVTAAVVVTLLQYFLDHQIGNTGGLAGMDTRAVLSTIQLVLQYVVNIALPFWQMGFLLVSLQLYRQEKPRPTGLLEGFRRFGPVLRLYLAESILMLAAVLVSSYVASQIYIFTPWSQPFMEKAMAIAEESGGSAIQMREAMLSIPADELTVMMKPVLIIMALILPFPLAVLYLRFRMAPFVLMDSDTPGALRALGTSRRITRHHRMKLLKLDLSFWWYYLMMGLATGVMYADVMIEYVVAELPFSGDALSLICYLAGSLLQLLVFWQLGSYVQTTQAAAYETLKLNYVPPKPPEPKPAPQNLPWDGYNKVN